MYGKVLVYLPTKLGNFGRGQMLVCISQHHGSHMGSGQFFFTKSINIPLIHRSVAPYFESSNESSNEAVKNPHSFCAIKSKQKKASIALSIALQSFMLKPRFSCFKSCQSTWVWVKIRYLN